MQFQRQDLWEIAIEFGALQGGIDLQVLKDYNMSILCDLRIVALPRSDVAMISLRDRGISWTAAAGQSHKGVRRTAVLP